jgi:hypothetical protein
VQNWIDEVLGSNLLKHPKKQTLSKFDQEKRGKEKRERERSRY